MKDMVSLALLNRRIAQCLEEIERGAAATPIAPTGRLAAIEAEVEELRRERMRIVASMRAERLKEQGADVPG